eukprot:6216050-Amphidinium_carterae.1
MRYRKIRTRHVYDSLKRKARSVSQGIRKGASGPEEDYSPTPSLTGMRVCLLVAAKAGHGTNLPRRASSAVLPVTYPRAPPLWAKTLGEML